MIESPESERMELISRLSRQIALLGELQPDASNPRFVGWKKETSDLLRQAVPDSHFLPDLERLTFGPLPCRVKGGMRFPDSAAQRAARFGEDRTEAENLLRSVIDELSHRSSSQG
jgi:hypothetical protein